MIRKHVANLSCDRSCHHRVTIQHVRWQFAMTSCSDYIRKGGLGSCNHVWSTSFSTNAPSAANWHRGFNGVLCYYSCGGGGGREGEGGCCRGGGEGCGGGGEEGRGCCREGRGGCEGKSGGGYDKHHSRDNKRDNKHNPKHNDKQHNRGTQHFPLGKFCLMCCCYHQAYVSDAPLPCSSLSGAPLYMVAFPFLGPWACCRVYRHCGTNTYTSCPCTEADHFLAPEGFSFK